MGRINDPSIYHQTIIRAFIFVFSWGGGVNLLWLSLVNLLSRGLLAFLLRSNDMGWVSTALHDFVTDYTKKAVWVHMIN